MIKRIFKSQLRINMASGLILSSVNIAAMLVAFPLYIHFLGLKQYGLWLVLATILNFAQLGNLGITQAVSKLVADCIGKNDYKEIKKIISSATVILVISGLVILSGIIGFRNIIFRIVNISQEDIESINFLIPWIGMLSIYVFIVQVVNAALQGLGRMDRANMAMVLGRITAVISSVMMLKSGLGIKSLLVGNTLCWILIHLLCLKYVKTHIKGNIFSYIYVSWAKAGELITFSSGIFFGSLLNMLLSPLNKLFIARYIGIESLAIYEIIYNASMQVRSMGESALRALMPEISRVASIPCMDALDKIKVINRKANKLITLPGGCFYLGLLMIAEIIFKYNLVPQYSGQVIVSIRIMLIASYLSLRAVPPYYTLMAVGKTGKLFVSNLIQSLGNVSVILLFIFTGQLDGISMIFTGVLAGMAGSMIYLIWQNYNLTADWSAKYNLNVIETGTFVG